MIEKLIEQHLVKGVKKLGGLCLKFVSPGSSGVPDRIIISSTGEVIFVELKTERGKLSKLQEHMIDEMRKRSANVKVLYGLQDVKSFLDELSGDDLK